MPRPKLPKQLSTTLKNILKTLKREKSPTRRTTPFTLPTGFVIPHPHAVHHATESDPPPSHILLRTAPDGGIRQILIPDTDSSTTDPVGIIVCRCNNPLNPDTTKPNTATLHTWEELKAAGEYPTLKKNEHFVASPTIFLDQFAEDQGGSPFLVSLPRYISGTHTLTDTNQIALTKILLENLQKIPADDSHPDRSEQIYLNLLEISADTYEEITETTRPTPSPHPRQAIVAWPQQPSGNLSVQFAQMFVTLNKERPPGGDYIQEDIREGAFVLVPFGPRTQVWHHYDPRDAYKHRAEYPSTTLDGLNTGIITKYTPTNHPEARLITELPRGTTENLIQALKDPTLQAPSQSSPTSSEMEESESDHREKRGRKHKRKLNTLSTLNTLSNTLSTLNTKLEKSRQGDNNLSPETSSDDTDPEKEKPKTKKSLKSTVPDNTLTPPELNSPETPEIFRTFFNMKAKTWEGDQRFVAPHYPPTITEIELPLAFTNIPWTELKAWAIAYQNYTQSISLTYAPQRQLRIKIHNTVSILQQKGKKDIITALRNNSPILATHKISDLTTQTISEFFEACRQYCFRAHIEWVDLANFCISRTTVGDEIYKRIQTRLGANPKLKEIASQISTFLEKTISDLMPPQLTYSNKFDMLVTEHKTYLHQAIPTTDHMKHNLEYHATELMYLHPKYQKAQEKGTSTWSTEDSKTLRDSITEALQEEIIMNTPFKAQLAKLYITSTYTDYKYVPRAKILNDLTSIIAADTTEGEYTAAVKHAAVKHKPPGKPDQQQSTQEPNTPRAALQPRCDICERLDLANCRRQNHCRIRGHQSERNPRNGTPAKPSNHALELANRGEPVQILRTNCKKCQPFNRVASINQHPPQHPPQQYQQIPPLMTIQRNEEPRRPPPPRPPYHDQQNHGPPGTGPLAIEYTDHQNRQGPNPRPNQRQYPPQYAQQNYNRNNPPRTGRQ